MHPRALTRRTLLGYGAALATAGATTLTMVGLSVEDAQIAEAESLGTLLDYAGGVPDADAIRDAGHTGVIRYVSDRRPGAEWMEGKPLQAREVDALRSAGLSIVSNYQFGKGPTADWRGGLEAGKRHGDRGVTLHRAAGGPDSAPLYVSIDDNPTAEEFGEQIVPYLLGWQSVVGPQRLGVYANSPTIDWARNAGLGTWFWQHNWGTPTGYVHPAAHLHQFEIDRRSVDGIAVDVNSILTPQYGQW
ncbi:DUF1906 domain-containing protein [Nocardia aurantia]|uniref:Putative peptidoglycan hydrolase n=1 Tax=Nocardia aurantia TaxID=2585199 RepID=A0A7K0DS29_9NOCA|nr:DUF1906 domain-containing protein [Nocardia aurantia]MQY28551.1 putative peptidoglycan hydrolase [Nocardia aurantia]